MTSLRRSAAILIAGVPLALWGQAARAAFEDLCEATTVAASLTSVLQRAGAQASASGQGQSRASLRGDLTATLAPSPGEGVDAQLFAHLRFGLGRGVTLQPTYSSSPNTLAFQPAEGDGTRRSYAIVAQAWGQLGVPLPAGDAVAAATQRLEFNLGKIDPFVFFDQNAVADDESTRFMNNVLVHNPLLDSGGDVGADRYGFAPGLRAAWQWRRAASWHGGLSLGIFGTGDTGDVSRALGRPFVIVQGELSSDASGQAGTVRVYAWTNPRASGIDGSPRGHRGWGVSADRQAGERWRLFGRYGRRTGGQDRFDRALTLGAEWTGAARGGALGAALAWLPTGEAWRLAANADTATAASGAERVAELYYRHAINEHVELSPDVQWIWRPAGRPSASFAVLGLRARLAF